jgi:hypothetical protein
MTERASYLMAEDPGTDLEIAEAMVAELEEYIVKDDLYRTLIIHTSSGDQNVRMTGGDLLARLHRLQGERASLPPAQQARLDAAQKSADTIIYSLRTRFHARLQREMKARLDSLRWYLDECDEDRARCRTNFPFEMRNRQRVEEILKQLGKDLPQDLTNLLKQVDRRIRTVAQGSDFIWDPRVRLVYPPERYWYLYLRP